MKTIVIRTNDINGKALILDEIMQGAMRWGYTFNKDTIVFNTKKEAMEAYKAHPCKNRGVKYIMLNSKQLKYTDFIKSSKERYCIALDKFLNLN